MKFELTKEKRRAEIKRIVAYQFDRVTNLTVAAYNDSLEMIAEQIEDIEEANNGV